MLVNIFLVVCVVIFSSFDVNCQKLYQKIVHHTDPQAKCLDGSPAALYLHEGDPHKILIYMVGGGSCGGPDLSTTLQNCYKRSKTLLGSSTLWPQVMIGEGVLSRDPKANFMANWTKVVLIYCDGSWYNGNTKQPYKYKQSQLYFRGSVIARSHFAYINKRFNFSLAQKVVLSGSSAGGIGTFLWADYLQTLLTNPNTQYYAVPDSGIFLYQDEPIPDHANLLGEQLGSDGRYESLYKIANRDESFPNQACAKALSATPWQCMNIQSAIRYLKTKTLFIQSSYDLYILSYQAKLTCLKRGKSGFTMAGCDNASLDIAHGYWDYYNNYLKYIMSFGHSVWTISCVWHAVMNQAKFYESDLQRVPMNTGSTIQKAIYDFVIGDQRVIHIDSQKWPSNTPCAY